MERIFRLVLAPFDGLRSALDQVIGHQDDVQSTTDSPVSVPVGDALAEEWVRLIEDAAKQDPPDEGGREEKSRRRGRAQLQQMWMEKGPPKCSFRRRSAPQMNQVRSRVQKESVVGPVRVGDLRLSVADARASAERSKSPRVRRFAMYAETSLALFSSGNHLRRFRMDRSPPDGDDEDVQTDEETILEANKVLHRRLRAGIARATQAKRVAGKQDHGMSI